MQEERFDRVDKNDEVIQEWLLESEIHPNDDITRVVTIYLCDAQGRYYLAQRSPNKKIDPLTFEAPTHGRVSSGESYEHALIRETEEELYVKLIDFTEIAHYYYAFQTNIGHRQHWKKLYIWSCEKIESYNTEEIYQLKQFESIEKLVEYYETHLDRFSPAVTFDMQHIKNYFNI